LGSSWKITAKKQSDVDIVNHFMIMYSTRL